MAPRETPIIYHNAGGTDRRFRGTLYFDVIERQFFQEKLRFKRPENLEIVLCHNYRDKPVAQRSLEHLGIFDYVVLGQNIHPWTNFLKIDLILDHLRNRCKTEYVLHIDAGDVLVTGDLAEVLKRFTREFECDALFNAEKMSSPGMRLRKVAVGRRKRIASGRPGPIPWIPEDFEKVRRIEEFEKSIYAAPFRHLNSGCYIGRRQPLIDFLEEVVSLKGFAITGYLEDDDQVLVREVHRRRYPQFQIDTRCRIFQCLYQISRQELVTRFPLDGMETHAFYLREQFYGVVRKGVKNMKKSLRRAMEKP